MPNKVAHFAIEADDIERARTFYHTVFDWEFEPWGPPGFYRIHGAGIQGALQKRQGSNSPGCKGFECSIAVSDISASTRAIESAGGTMIGPKHEIPMVGQLAQFHDTEGNQAIIVQYTDEVAEEAGLS